MPDAVSSSTLALSSWSDKVKKTAWIALALVGILLAFIVVVPHFIDLGVFKRAYLPRVEDALNRRLDVGEVRLSLVPSPSIRLSNLKVSDSPANAENTIFSAEQVHLRLRFWPLLKGRFELSELVLKKPIFNLRREPDGTFNYSAIANKSASASSPASTKKREEALKPKDAVSVPLFIPNNLTIRDGQLNYIARGQTPVNVKGIELSLREFSSNAPFPFRTSFIYPGLKAVSLEGELEYRDQKALLELKNNRLKINDLTFPVQGSISNLAATPRVNLDLGIEHADAKPIFEILSLFGLAPRGAEIAGPMDFSVNVSGPSNSLMTRVHGLFKNVQVHGKRALRGHLSGEVLIYLPMGGGPLSQRIQGNGKLAASNGALTNIDLIKKIERVTGMIGLSRDERRQATTFQKMEAEFILGGGYAEFTRLHVVNPQMEASGAGTMTIAQPSLEVSVNTTLSPQVSARAGRSRMISYFKNKQGRIVVPLRISGPVENPSLDLNAGKIAAAGMPENVEKGFNSFFKRLFRNR